MVRAVQFAKRSRIVRKRVRRPTVALSRMWSFSARSVALVLFAVGLTVALGEEYSGSDLRIVGGFPASQQVTMHQVSIRRKAGDVPFGNGHICGGSLINNRTILTAAHCLVDNSDRKRAASYFRVVGGNLNRSSNSNDTAVLDVSQVVVHQRYNPRNFDNDVGLLILNSIVSASHPTLRPINMTTVKPNPGVVCQTSGWGTQIYNVSASPLTLLAVNVTIQPTEICNGSSSYKGFIRHGTFCAGEVQGGRDACQGDSGGPLVCNGILAGIVSNGIECGLAAYPGIYVDVAYYRDWILRNGVGRTVVAGWSITMTVAALMYGFVQRRLMTHGV